MLGGDFRTRIDTTLLFKLETKYFEREDNK